MTVARVACRAQVGLHAPLVQVEVSLAAGLPAFCIVGLPATVIKESKERVRAALLNSRFVFPAGRITVSLSPAELPKEGGRFDLPIALGILLASGQLSSPACPAPGSVVAREFYGELGLNGNLEPVHGMLLAAAHARQQDHELIVPHGNAAEACAVAPRQTRAARHLLEVCAHVSGAAPLAPCSAAPSRTPTPLEAAALLEPVGDLAEVRGQALAKRALIVAASGSHSLLFVGPPGCGKSMLAQRLPGLLPPLAEEEALEVAAIAAASTVGFRPALLGRRPFRAPHHTASAAALVGGGARARPGEISLAHRGVLFLDELTEFSRGVLEALREPLESGVVAVSRAALQIQYPADFQLVAAMNPCPCGGFGDRDGRCRCTPREVERYRARLSGPLLDRLDLRVEMTPLAAEELAAAADSTGGSAAAAARVARARALQCRRQGVLNARLSDAGVARWCAPDAAGARLLERTLTQFRLSLRTRQRVLRIARSIADLESSPAVRREHIAEALVLRGADRGATAPSASSDRRPA